MQKVKGEKSEMTEKVNVKKIEMTQTVFDEVVRYLVRRPYCEVKELLGFMDANCKLVKQEEDIQPDELV